MTKYKFLGVHTLHFQLTDEDGNTDGKLYEPIVAMILLVDRHGVFSRVCENLPLEPTLVFPNLA